MKNELFIALICGYGIPKDIMTDRSYHAYLVAVTNWLYDRYRDTPGKIIMNGSPTDIIKPYRRTEANEIAKWMHDRLLQIKKASGSKPNWKP